MFRVFRLFVTVSMMGAFWLIGTVGGVFLGALLVSRGGQDYWRRVKFDGTTVDFYEGLEKRGFTFDNPNAVKSCGCGSSFSA